MPASLMKSAHGAIEVGDNRCLRDFEDQPLRRDAAVRTIFAILRIDLGDTRSRADRLKDRSISAGQVATAASALRSRMPVMRPIWPERSAAAMKSQRRAPCRAWGYAAGKGLEAHGAAGLCIHLRLENDEKLLFQIGMAQGLIHPADMLSSASWPSLKTTTLAHRCRAWHSRARGSARS